MSWEEEPSSMVVMVVSVSTEVSSSTVVSTRCSPSMWKAIAWSVPSIWQYTQTCTCPWSNMAPSSATKFPQISHTLRP